MKIKYFIFLMIIIPVQVFAYGVDFSCPKTVKSGETFSCTVYSPSICNELSMNLVLPDGFVYQGEKVGKNIKSVGTGTSLSYTASGTLDRVLTTLNIKAPELSEDSNMEISLKNLKYKYEVNDSEFTVTSDITEVVGIIGDNKTTTTTKTSNNGNLVLVLKSNEENVQTLACTPSNGSCEIDLSSVNNPSKDGYVFNGWGNDANCTEGIIGKYSINKNGTLYACFKLNTNYGELKSLSINGNKVGLETKKYEYTVNYNGELDDLKVDATAKGSGATVNVKLPDAIVIGNNVFHIYVTEKGITNDYIITLNKEPKGPYLLDLKVEGYPLNFEIAKFVYDITVPYSVKSLQISPSVNDISTTYVITNNDNLKNGSVINIELTSESGEKVTYVINVTMQSFFDTYKTYIISGIVVIFMFIVYFIVRGIKTKNGEIKSKPKKEKKKKPKKEKNKKVKKNKNIDVPEAEIVNNTEIETLD